MSSFNIKNYQLTDEQLIYWICLLNTSRLKKEIDRIDKVTRNIFSCVSKPLNNKKKK